MKTHQQPWQNEFDHWIKEGTAQSTRRAYIRDTDYFWSWMNQHLSIHQYYPVTTEHVLQFCLYHIREGSPSPLKLSTLRRYLSSLSIVHMDKGIKNPVRADNVKLLLRRAKSAKKEQPNKKLPITRDLLLQLVASCDRSMTGLRDKAVLMLGFCSGGRRRSEIASFKIDQLSTVDDGYLIEITKSKTDQFGDGFIVPVYGVAAKALKAWLDKSKIKSGALFRGIKPDNSFYDGISPRTINLIVKRRIKMIGLDPVLYGAHSLRSGFITETSHQGINLTQAMMLTGHKSIKIAQGYCHDNALVNNKASYLLT